jgi:hypothetical protein
MKHAKVAVSAPTYAQKGPFLSSLEKPVSSRGCVPGAGNASKSAELEPSGGKRKLSPEDGLRVYMVGLLEGHFALWAETLFISSFLS